MYNRPAFHRFAKAAILALIIVLSASALAFGAADHVAADKLVMIDKTVAADGSGDFKTVQAALDSVPHDNKKPYVILIKPGTYQEKLRVEADRPYVHLIGTVAEKTVLTYDDYARKNGADGKPLGTHASASMTIKGHDFQADNITFENSAAPREVVAQAVALSVEADRCTFRHCRFLGHQDTLYANNGREYYRDCFISGDVDFIFGNATAVFENCEIQSVGKGYVTAQSRTDSTQTTGYVFVDCRLTGIAPSQSVYLGRPWRPYARVVYLRCALGDHIRPDGWDNWRDPAREKTAYYGEYQDSGPGAKSDVRVAWSHQLTSDEARAYDPTAFLKGDDGWNPRAAAASKDFMSGKPG